MVLRTQKFLDFDSRHTKLLTRTKDARKHWDRMCAESAALIFQIFSAKLQHVAKFDPKHLGFVGFSLYRASVVRPYLKAILNSDLAVIKKSGFLSNYLLTYVVNSTLNRHLIVTRPLIQFN